MESILDLWLIDLSKGEVGELESGALWDVFEALGVDFSVLMPEDIQLLRKYSNRSKGPAIKKLLGEERKREFNTWVKWWAESHSEVAPSLKPAKGQERSNPSNVEGPTALFYELLAYAADALTWEEFYRNISARSYNGLRRQEGNPEKQYRFHIVIPGYNIMKVDGEERELPFAPASFAPEFPLALRDFLKQW